MNSKNTNSNDMNSKNTNSKNANSKNGKAAVGFDRHDQDRRLKLNFTDEEIECLKEIKIFCQQIEEKAQELLVIGLSDIVEFIKGNIPIDKKPFPGFIMIKTFFEEYSFATYLTSANMDGEIQRISCRNCNTKKLNIVDGYNYNNDVKYSGINYSEFPPWGQLSEIEKHLGEYLMNDIFEYGTENFLQSIKKNVRIDIISEKIKSENQKNNGEIMHTNSSWLDE